MSAAVGQGFDASRMTREHSLSTGGQIDAKIELKASFMPWSKHVWWASLTASRPNLSRRYRHHSRHLQNKHQEQARDARMSVATASQSRNTHISKSACPMKLPAGVGMSAQIVTRRWHRLEAGPAQHVLNLTVRQLGFYGLLEAIRRRVELSLTHCCFWVDLGIVQLDLSDLLRTAFCVTKPKWRLQAKHPLPLAPVTPELRRFGMIQMRLTIYR